MTVRIFPVSLFLYFIVQASIYSANDSIRPVLVQKSDIEIARLRQDADFYLKNGNYDAARKSVEKLISKTSSKYDYLRLLRIECKGDTPSAVQSALIAIIQKDITWTDLFSGAKPPYQEACDISVEYFRQKKLDSEVQWVLLEASKQNGLPPIIKLERLSQYLDSFIGSPKYSEERTTFLKRVNLIYTGLKNTNPVSRKTYTRLTDTKTAEPNEVSYTALIIPYDSSIDFAELDRCIICTLIKDNDCPIELVRPYIDSFFDKCSSLKYDDPKLQLPAPSKLLAWLNDKKEYALTRYYSTKIIAGPYADIEKAEAKLAEAFAAYMQWDIESAAQVWKNILKMHISPNSDTYKTAEVLLKEYNTGNKLGLNIKIALDNIKELMNKNDFEKALELAVDNAKNIPKTAHVPDVPMPILFRIADMEQENYILMLDSAIKIKSNRDINVVLDFWILHPELCKNGTLTATSIQKTWDYAVEIRNSELQDKLKKNFLANLVIK